MEKLIFDTGIKEYAVNDGGTLRFNPTDQNVYARFVEFYNEIGAITKEYDQAVEEYRKCNPDEMQETDDKGFEVASKLMDISKETDRAIKDRLVYVFGPQNDFDKMLSGVNIMAMTDTGNMVIENFLDALLPVIESNADERKKIMDAKVKDAVKKSQTNRAQRRAIAYGKVDPSSNS